MSQVVAFDKYARSGAYHWIECDRRYANWKRYNPAVDARYEITTEAVKKLGVHRNLLDVGCGDGVLMARVAPLIEQVVGIDSEEDAIHWAREKLRPFPNCEVIRSSCYQLPFEDKSFEAITSADVIEHLKEPQSYLREVCRVLRPDGAFVLTTPQWRSDRKWDIRHEREYQPEEIRALLTQFFDEVTLRFFWPKFWSSVYSTRLGWRLLKLCAIQWYNPFLRIGSEPEQFGQMLAICRKPRVN